MAPVTSATATPAGATPAGATLASATLASATLRSEMVSALQRVGAIRSDPVRRAFLAVPRDEFVPEIVERDGLEAVYRPDAALVVAADPGGARISSSPAPVVMAAMLEALELRPGQKVLEIGTGTGYNTALLKWLVGDTGTVISVELDAAFARRARYALARAHCRCHVVVGDGRAGWLPGAPFHRIEVTASTPEMARAWQEQLVNGGLVELPLQPGSRSAPQVVLTLRRQGASLRSTSVLPANFTPLRPPSSARSA